MECFEYEMRIKRTRNSRRMRNGSTGTFNALTLIPRDQSTRSARQKQTTTMETAARPTKKTRQSRTEINSNPGPILSPFDRRRAKTKQCKINQLCFCQEQQAILETAIDTTGLFLSFLHLFLLRVLSPTKRWRRWISFFSLSLCCFVS